MDYNCRAMYLTRHSNVTDRAVVESLWELYEVAYQPLAASEPTREMLFRTEFDEVLADPANRLYVVREENRPIAMAMVATDIGSTRYLSRPYFEQRFPERMAAGLIHYIMWIVVHPEFQASDAVFHLARGGLGPEQAEGALLVFDLPESRQPNERGAGAELFYRLAQMVGPVGLHSFGASRYYALDFAPERSETPAAARAREGAERVDA